MDMRIKKILRKKLLDFLQDCREEKTNKFDKILPIEILEQCVKIQKENIENSLKNDFESIARYISYFGMFNSNFLEFSFFFDSRERYQWERNWFIFKILRFFLLKCLEKTLEKFKNERIEKNKLEQIIEISNQEWRNNWRERFEIWKEEIIKKFQTEPVKEDIKKNLEKETMWMRDEKKTKEK